MKVFSCLFGKICSLFKYVKGYYLYNKLNKKLRLSENEIAFIPSWGIGDHIIVASLASEIKSHYDANSFVLVVRQKFASLGLEKLFKSIDKVVYVKDKVFLDITQSNYAVLRSTSYPQKGMLNNTRIYAVRKLTKILGLTFGDLVKIQLGLSLSSKFSRPEDVPDDVVKQVRRKLLDSEICLPKAILVSLASNTVQFEKREIYYLMDYIVEYFIPQGYDLLFNERKWYDIAKDRYTKIESHFKFLDVNLLEAFTIGKLCGKVITVRSGFSDLMAFTGSKVLGFYPNRSQYEDIQDIKYIDFYPLSRMFKEINPSVMDIELGNENKIKEGFEYLLQ